MDGSTLGFEKFFHIFHSFSPSFFFRRYEEEIIIWNDKRKEDVAGAKKNLHENEIDNKRIN
jgi:hypothetical protein